MDLDDDEYRATRKLHGVDREDRNKELKERIEKIVDKMSVEEIIQRIKEDESYE